VVSFRKDTDMVVRNIWSVVACMCVVGAVGCHKKSEPGASSVPVITSFTPTSGLTGSTVTLTGSGFDGTTNVSVGGAVATFSHINDGQITLTVPTDAMSGIIGVVNSMGSGGTTAVFNVTPTVTLITPSSGSPGTVVTLTGTGLGGIQKVVFGTGPASNYLVNSANQAQAVVAWGSSTGPVTVTASNGTTATSPVFTYSNGGATAPTNPAFAPAQAKTGDFVTLTGTGFTGVSSVKIGGVSSFFTLVNDTTINVQVPSAAISGFIEVSSFLGTGTSATRFIVTPTLTGFAPAQGSANTLVTLKGTGFNGTTSVTFGNATLSNFVVTDANTALANVATGSATGPISLMSNGVPCTSTASFTFLADAVNPPVINTITPIQAATGTPIVLTGTGFTGVTDIEVGGAPVSQFSVDSDTQITLTVPNAAATGFISATNVKGVYGSTTVFKVTPTITAFSPAAGKVGATVSLIGTGFSGTTTVSFGASSPANFVVLDANHLTAQVPADATTAVVNVTSSGISCASAAPFTVQP
jgi:large repetitive protein